MIIRYVKEQEYKDEKKDESLTLGKDYLVLGVIMEQGYYSNGKKKEPYVCIQADDDGYPCLFDLKFFDVMDSRVPDGWSFSRLKSGAYCLEPEEFKGDFWDRFHEGEPSEIEKIIQKHQGIEYKSAEETFQNVLKKIKHFHEIEEEPLTSEDPYAWPFEEYR